MNLNKFIYESLDENKELQFWIKFFFVFFAFFNIFGLLISKDPWDEFYDLINSILVNVLAAFMFYILVVYIPEKKAKKIRKRNFKIIFQTTKRSILDILLQMTAQKNTHDFEELLQPIHFKKLFKDSDWSEVKHKLTHNKKLTDEIITELDILKTEILFILGKLEASDSQIYNFLKYLSLIIHKHKPINSSSLDIDSLIDFLNKFFSGYNWSTKEYSKDDVIDNILKKI